MADKELATILNSGGISSIYLGDTGSEDKVPTTGEVETLIDAAHGSAAFSDAVGAETALTGIVSIEDIVSLNTDITKIDIEAFDYFIQGDKYNYAGITATTPTIEADDSSTFVGVDASGLLYSDDKFTDEEKKTIIPLARLQAVQGDSGPGSDLQEPLHLTFPISQEGYNERTWIENTIGVLYASGGTYTENATAALQVDQDDGIFYNAQRKRMVVTTDTNIEVSSVYHVSGAPTVQDKATFVVPKFYDDGTDLVALPDGKYVSHTLLRSPKEEDLFFLIYGAIIYDSLSQAEDARADYSIFQDQATSGLYKVARFVVKGDSTSIEAIQDERPTHMLEDASTGTGVKEASSACMYLSSPTETTITTDGVFVKIAGTTDEVTTSADFETVGDNRFLYTGKTTRRFKAEVVCSITSAGNNQTVRARFAVNGTTLLPSEQQQVGVGTRVGNLALNCMPELAENDYIEFWIANIGATSNLTVDYMNMNLISAD